MTTNHLQLPGYEPVFQDSTYQRQIDPSRVEVVEIARRDLPGPYELVRTASDAAKSIIQGSAQPGVYSSLVEALNAKPDELGHWARPSVVFKPYVVIAYSRGDFGPPLSTGQVLGAQPCLEVMVSTMGRDEFDCVRDESADDAAMSRALARATGIDQAMALVEAYGTQAGHEVFGLERRKPEGAGMSMAYEAGVRRTGLAVAQVVERQEAYELLDDRSQAYWASEAEKLVRHVHGMLESQEGFAKAVQAAFRGDMV